MLLNIAYELAKQRVHSHKEGGWDRIGYLEWVFAYTSDRFVISSMDDLTVLAQTEKEMQRIVNRCLVTNAKNKDVVIVNNIQCNVKGNCDLKCRMCNVRFTY